MFMKMGMRCLFYPQHVWNATTANVSHTTTLWRISFNHNLQSDKIAVSLFTCLSSACMNCYNCECKGSVAQLTTGSIVTCYASPVSLSAQCWLCLILYNMSVILCYWQSVMIHCTDVVKIDISNDIHSFCNVFNTKHIWSLLNRQICQDQVPKLLVYDIIELHLKLKTRTFYRFIYEIYLSWTK